MSNSKKHHYVPQSILRGFSIDKKRSKIEVLDLDTANVWKSSIQDAASENHFNTFTDAGVQRNLEGAFNSADSRLAALLQELLTHRNLLELDPKIRAEWANLLAIQMTRVQIQRDTLQAIPRMLFEAFSDMGIEGLNLEEISDDEAKRASLKITSESHHLTPHLLKMDWVLYECSKTRHFCISDNPIVVGNDFGKGGGVATQGARVHWPLSDNIALHLSCPSISARYRYLNLSAVAFLKSSPTIPLPSSWVSTFNELQATNATRFVYGASSELNRLQRIAGGFRSKGQPNVKMSVGSWPANPTLPPGNWLEVEGAITYHRCQVMDYDDRDGNLRVRVETIESVGLRHAIEDAPQVSIELTTSSGRQYMRDVELIPDPTDPLRVIIRHNTPG